MRSTPAGRGGTGGSSPSAMRSVQSANIPRARSRPKRFIPAFIEAPRCPVCTRWSQAARAESKSSSWSISRVMRLPSWWQSWQPCFMRSTHRAWLVIPGEMPLPSGPVPGNSLPSGTSIREYQ